MSRRKVISGFVGAILGAASFDYATSEVKVVSGASVAGCGDSPCVTRIYFADRGYASMIGDRSPDWKRGDVVRWAYSGLYLIRK